MERAKLNKIMAVRRFFITFIILFLNSVSTTYSLDIYSELQSMHFEDDESVCVQDIKSIFDTSSADDSLWALQMIDSSAKVPNGILGGTLIHIGMFDECLKVVHPNGNFTGQHCMANLGLSISTNKYSDYKRLSTAFTPKKMEREGSAALSLLYGICLPSSCTADELNKIFNSSNMADVVSITFKAENCWTNEPTSFSSGSWALISILLILIALAVCSTLYELYMLHVLKKKKDKSSTLTAFSLYSNTVGLFEIRDSSGEMACLHGIRTLSMMWVVLCHTFSNVLNLPMINSIDAIEVVMGIKYIIILNGVFSVDSFFFLSGLLVAFVFFRNIGRSGYYDAPVNYIHRYLRLTPSLLIMVLFNMTLLMDLDKGPRWGDLIKVIGPDCSETWWSTILYVQNYAQPYAQCVGQSWYLAADMQMFWIAPLILYPIYLWPKPGMAFLGFLTIGSTLLTFGLAYQNEYAASLSIAGKGSLQFAYDYITTHSRIMPWFVGVALGVAICAIKSHKIKINLSKIVVIVGWLFSTAVCLAVLYGLNRFQGDVQPTLAESTIYLSFSRLGWGVGLAWVVFACIYGYGGWINSFLSWGIFQPLGKLSYNVYLVHLTILTYLSAVYRTNFYFSDFNVLYNYFGTLVISYLFAIILYLLLDAPFAILDRKLLGKLKVLPYPSINKQDYKNEKNNIELGVKAN